MSRLLESALVSCWEPFSDDALLERPDWSELFFTFGLYSVITTVTLFTVTSFDWAVLRSMFFRRGGCLFLRLGLSSLRSLLSLPLLFVELVLPSFFPGFNGGTYCCWAAYKVNIWISKNKNKKVNKMILKDRRTCCATNWGFMRGFRVEVPLRTSHMRHLNASAVFL